LWAAYILWVYRILTGIYIVLCESNLSDGLKNVGLYRLVLSEGGGERGSLPVVSLLKYYIFVSVRSTVVVVVVVVVVVAVVVR
jgi:hypothetical protein